MPDTDHLQMIQGVITRMASNSFSLKTICVTLTAAVIAYFGAVPSANWTVAVGGAAAITTFWLLDAMYLRLEQQFRKLYDAASEDKVTKPFSMNFVPFAGDVPSVLRIALSWSAVWLYLVQMLLLVTLVFVHRPPQ
jgi:hypothetical protein